MALGMFLSSIPRSVIEGGRWRVAAERPVVADISPDAARYRLALGQDRHRGVVAVQTLGAQDVGLDQLMQRLKDQGASADLVGQRRHAEIDALPSVSFTLPV